MTPEERFNKIEQLLYTTAEQHARQQEQLGKFGQEIEKQNEGIRSLIVVARTSLDSFKEVREQRRKDNEEWAEKMKDLRETQAEIGEKLNILIATVDRLIRRENHP
jgi:hypothetical protein